jgi:hypothetical protein
MLDNGQDHDYLLSLPSCSLSQGLTLLTVGARMTTPIASYTDHIIATVSVWRRQNAFVYGEICKEGIDQARRHLPAQRVEKVPWRVSQA